MKKRQAEWITTLIDTIMKKWMGFVLGIIVGMIIMGFVNTIKMTSDNGESNDNVVDVGEKDGVLMFKEPGDNIDVKSFNVFQVLAQNAALVKGESYKDVYTGIIYLLINEEGIYYYDDQIVKAPKGTIVKQVGIYNYITTDNMKKTVPIIKIMNGQ